MRILRLSLLPLILAGLTGLAHASTPVRIASSRPPAPLGLSIQTEGIYRLAYSYLRAHGFNPSSVDVRKLGIADDGAPVPVYLHHVKGHGHTFRPKDYLEFYGHPVDNTYTNTNVYVLSDDGKVVDHVKEAHASAAASPVRVASNTYVDQQRTIRFVETPPDHAYSTSIAWPATGDAYWKEVDLPMFSGQSSTSSSVNFQLASPNSAGTCSISAPTTAYPYTSTTETPSYVLGITVGSTAVTDNASHSTTFTWEGTTATASDYNANGTFPCSGLTSSARGLTDEQVTFASSLQPGVQFAEVLPQYFSITYPENLCAAGNQLRWQGTAPASYTISGFQSRNISVWRILRGKVSRLAGLPGGRADNSGTCGGGYQSSFTSPGSGGALYFASSQALLPASAARLNLKSVTTGFDGSARYLIITSPQFASAVHPLAAYHRKHGLTVKVVTTDRIYDQFRSSRGHFSPGHRKLAPAGDGQLNPEAIRAYVTFAVKHFGTQYVLLAGGNTDDYHNYWGCPSSGMCSSSNPNNVSIVPSLYVPATYSGLTESDNLYAVSLKAHNTAPDVALGRLPAYTVAQMKTEIERTISWPSWAQSYQRRATFVAGYEDGQFHTSSDLMAGLLPATWNVTKPYEDGAPADDQAVHQKLLSQFDAGQEIVNFVGHGNLTQWSHAAVLQSSDIPDLTNSDKPAAVFQWGCEATDLDPRLPTMDELLLNATDTQGRPTGAVVTVGSSGLDLAYQQAVLAGGTTETGATGEHYFYGYLTAGDSVGVALEKAKRDITKAHGDDSAFVDVVNSYQIFGDPALFVAM